MLGLVFTSLIEMMEEKFSYEFSDEVLEEAKLANDGAFTAVGYYDFHDLVNIASIISKKTETPMPALLTAFGEHLMHDIADGHPHILEHYPSLFSMLEQLDSEIHVRVKQLYENARLPEFKVVQRSENSIDMLYRSERRLEYLAVGLLNTASQLFKEPISVEVLAPDADEADAIIRVTRLS